MIISSGLILFRDRFPSLDKWHHSVKAGNSYPQRVLSAYKQIGGAEALDCLPRRHPKESDSGNQEKLDSNGQWRWTKYTGTCQRFVRGVRFETSVSITDNDISWKVPLLHGILGNSSEVTSWCYANLSGRYLHSVLPGGFLSFYIIEASNGFICIFIFCPISFLSFFLCWWGNWAPLIKLNWIEHVCVHGFTLFGPNRPELNR